MKFIDEVTVFCRAGKGGNGCVAWRREAGVPMGGPSGGDGGNGGHIAFVADEGLHSLLDHKYNPHIRADGGEDGRSKNQFGKKGETVLVKVPVGTQIFDKETGELLHDFTDADVEVQLLKGGSGGHGNARFTSSTRQSPDFAKPGLEGEDKILRLSLKLLADVGLLGFPNAGKSTFLSRVSAAQPKIADYPFTTLTPQLGVVEVERYYTFVMADVPGLIEGASEGLGLGHQFLKHLERVRVLCHLIEAPVDYTGVYPEREALAANAEESNADDEASVSGESESGEDEENKTLSADSENTAVELDSDAESGSEDAGKSESEEHQEENPHVAAPVEVEHGDEALVVRYEALRTELLRYSETLASSPEVVVLNKAELLDDAQTHPQVVRLKEHLKERGTFLMFMSAATGEGVTKVVKTLWNQVVREKPSKVIEAPFDPYAKMR
ncbi:MAG: GTPase ObgE [Deltaproteobacteria bacterium]|nr:GTPase ObgE [Deltaproteobacteria bacterium]